MFNFAH